MTARQINGWWFGACFLIIACDAFVSPHTYDVQEVLSDPHKNQWSAPDKDLLPRSTTRTNQVLGPKRVNQKRAHFFDLSDFGSIGDGAFDNTRVFQNAIYAVSTVVDKGGGQLFVPPGNYLTGSFNLTSFMTLYLANGATILGSPDPSLWPIIPPLPSYGRGRELPGPRYSSLIHGQNLTDVVITGDNGTIDGQGEFWWDRAQSGLLQHTRGSLVELLWCSHVAISNITLKNSPYWALHPVYCSDFLVQNITILAPEDSPNTEGISPDSCSRVLVENCNISTGDDGLSVKSGWDRYGQDYAQPSRDIIFRNIRTQSPLSAGMAIGSEMSGGISNVTFSGIVVSGSKTGFRLKTSPGRGGYIRDIVVESIRLERVGTAISFLPEYGQHPDPQFDPLSLPDVRGISFRNWHGIDILVAGELDGLQKKIFSRVRLQNVSLELSHGGKGFFCSSISGWASNVSPPACPELQPESTPNHITGITVPVTRNQGAV